MTVYLIKNKVNGMVYVGQTVRAIKDRWKQHLSPRSCCRYLKHAIQKYGKDSFEVIPLASALTFDDLNKLEEQFIREFNSVAPNGYNLNSGGKSRIASQETRERISLAHKGKPHPGMKGHIPWNLGLKMGPQPKWLIDRRNEAATLAKLKPIQCIETGRVYDSLKSAVQDLGISQGNLSLVLAGKRKQTGGYSFKFVSKP